MGDIPFNGKLATADRERGFTLLELMIVILILSLIVIMLTSGVRFAGRAWATQERLIDQQGDFSAIQTILRQLVASGHDFEGDDMSLRFVGPMPKALQRGGLFDIALMVEDGRLVVTWTPHFMGAGPKPDGARTDLVKDVSSFDVGYYFSDDKEAAGWHLASPSDRSVAPSLILIRVQRTIGKAWPALVVAPAIDAAPSQKK